MLVPSPAPGPDWRDQTGAVAAAFAACCGLPADGWERSPVGAAAGVWLNGPAGVVIKVHRPGIDADLLGRRTQVCAAARNDGARIAGGGVGGDSGPFDVGGWTVTVWERLSPDPATATGLGAALASLHRNERGRCRAEEVSLPPARHVRAVDRWGPFWDCAEPDEVKVLYPWVEWAQEAAAALVDGTVVHGDVNSHNALGGDEAVLIDIDALGVAWAAADIVAARNRFSGTDWGRFSDAYGPMPDAHALDISALIVRVANSALWDIRGRRERAPGAAGRLRRHLELFASTAPPSAG